MITTFGEVMLRISPEFSSFRINQSSVFRIEPGGSEANVAIALKNLGLDVQFVSCLPDSKLNKIVFDYLWRHGVRTRIAIKSRLERLGIYWTENGIGPRSSHVIYDRDYSAFQLSKYSDYPWPEIIKETKWLHFSGITPSLSSSLHRILQRLLKSYDGPYSVDLNYRNLLWGWVNDKKTDIKHIMSELCSQAQLITGNESDFNIIFNISDHTGNSREDNYKQIADKMFLQFKDLKYLAISDRHSESASLNLWKGYLFTNFGEINMYIGKEYKIESIVDRVGTGDCFTAGIIFGILNRSTYSNQEIVDFAVTLAALNHSTIGDASFFDIEDVKSTLKSGGCGRINR